MKSTIRQKDALADVLRDLETGWDPVSLTHSRLWRPNLIVFISSGCIMILELVAGRIIAPYVGVSLYTWTSIIGVVLAGISAGNYLGGLLADRWASLRFLGGIFLLGGLTSMGVLTVDVLGWLTPPEMPIVTEILLLTTALFFIPCVLLGMISPIVAKLVVRDLSRTGSTVGKIYAAGTVGSIAGTFATGFFLISWFGTHAIIWGVAITLLAMGLILISHGRWRLLAFPALLLVSGSLFAYNQGWLRGPCTRETNYFCIRVHEDERDGKLVRVLTLDRLVHSHSSLDDPTRLTYRYERIYAEVAAYQAQDKHPLRALFIGGGGYTFPRYMEAVYPASEIHVLEIDPGVTQIAHDSLGLNSDTRIMTFHEDARLYLERPPDMTYDLIMGDAFNDFSVPYHLTTKEFNERVRIWLAHDGIYFVNIVDGPKLDFVRALAHTLRQTFHHVYLAPTHEHWRKSSHNTFVLIASDVKLDRNRLKTIGGNDTSPLLSDQLLSDEDLTELLAQAPEIILTDRYAPVDQLLARIYREEIPK